MRKAKVSSTTTHKDFDPTGKPTTIMVLEDAKTTGKPVYTAFADFKGAFNGTDHRHRFELMRNMGMPECYVRTCEHIYSTSRTAYITPHDLTPRSRYTEARFRGHTLPLPLHPLHGAPHALDHGGRPGIHTSMHQQHGGRVCHHIRRTRIRGRH